PALQPQEPPPMSETDKLNARRRLRQELAAAKRKARQAPKGSQEWARALLDAARIDEELAALPKASPVVYVGGDHSANIWPTLLAQLMGSIEVVEEVPAS